MKRNREQTRYLIFPIVLLKNAFFDVRGAMADCFTYCVYSEFHKLCNVDGYTPSGFFNEDDPDFLNAMEKVGINFPNPSYAFERGESLFFQYPESMPKVSLSFEMMMDFRNNFKTEFEIVCFLAFAAIRSILQRQAYSKIGNDYLLARMAGNSKSNDPLPEWIEKYQSRYQLDKIKIELQSNWGLKLYGQRLRGYYVSFTIELHILIKYAEERRKIRKENELKDQRAEAYQKAMKMLNK